MRARDIPARDRLLAKLIVQPNGCCHWTGFIDKMGYGRLGYRGRRSTPLQQAVYTEFVGPIPPGMVPDHVCHTDDLACPGGPACLHRRCGNPAHLELVTAAENNRRGNARITHCPFGHEYSPENTYRYVDNRRFCRACNNRRTADLKRRKRA